MKFLLDRSLNVWFCVFRGDVSESEAEDDGESHVTLPQKLSSRGNIEAGQSAIRLHELGPRMKLKVQ